MSLDPDRTEIEITPEMIEAASVLMECGNFAGDLGPNLAGGCDRQTALRRGRDLDRACLSARAHVSAWPAHLHQSALRP